MKSALCGQTTVLIGVPHYSSHIVLCSQQNSRILEANVFVPCKNAARKQAAGPIPENRQYLTEKIHGEQDSIPLVVVLPSTILITTSLSNIVQVAYDILGDNAMWW